MHLHWRDSQCILKGSSVRHPFLKFTDNLCQPQKLYFIIIISTLGIINICMLLCVQLRLRLVHSHSVLTPSEYVAYEGQPEFTFQCTVTGPGVQFIVVRVDCQQLDSQSVDMQGITSSDPVQLGNTTSHQVNITIPATLLNEDTTIDCLGVLSSGVTNSVTNRAIATFKVQGKVLYYSSLFPFTGAYMYMWYIRFLHPCVSVTHVTSPDFRK